MYCGLKWSGVDGGGVVVIHCARSCYTSVRTTSTEEEDEEKVVGGDWSRRRSGETQRS